MYRYIDVSDISIYRWTLMNWPQSILIIIVWPGYTHHSSLFLKKRILTKFHWPQYHKIKIKLVYSKIKWAIWNYKLDLIALLSNLKSVGCKCRVVFVFRWLNDIIDCFAKLHPPKPFFLSSYPFLWFRSNLYIYSSKCLRFSWPIFFFFTFFGYLPCEENK